MIKRKQMHKLGKKLIIIGISLIAVSTFISIHNIYEEKQAGKNSANVLNIMKENQDLWTLTSNILLQMKEVFNQAKPDMVLVHGDTTTAMATALSAFYAKIPVGHVEAGLRTGNIYSPWPEEMNRLITGRIATYHFSPTQLSRQNLLKENVAVRDLKTILETISLQSKINKNPNFLTEHVRQALSRNICKQNLADTGELYVITLSPDIENTIAKGASPDGSSVTLDPSFTRSLFEKMNLELEKAITATGNQPVILCSSPIRLLYRKLVERTYPQIAIMSYNEISPSVKVKSVGIIK
mgnify:CR=1 FL=1